MRSILTVALTLALAELAVAQESVKPRPAAPKIQSHGKLAAPRKGVAQGNTAALSNREQLRNRHSNETPSLHQVIWTQCFEKEVSVRILSRRFSETIKACISVEDRGDGLYICGSLQDAVSFCERLDILCYEIPYGVFTLKVCVTDIDLMNGRITITVEGCVGFEYRGVGVEKCVDLFEGTIQFFAYQAMETVIIAVRGDDGQVTYVRERRLVNGYISADDGKLMVYPEALRAAPKSNAKAKPSKVNADER